MSISAFCMPWHVTASDAFERILVSPLRGLLRITLTPWDENPALPMQYFAQDRKRPLLFCQLPPPATLLEQSDARLAWIPMWDEVASWPSTFWQSLPKTVRIIAFCEPVEQQARLWGLPCLRLRFFLDPALVEPVSHGNNRRLLYWNRIGLYSQGALARICRDLEIAELVHVFRPDPRYASTDLLLPERIGRTDVSTIREVLPEKDYARLLASCNLALAPRPVEGVGLTVLQSMVRGACVLAYDGPATNEYVVHGHSGHLFRSYSRRVHNWRKSLGKRWHRLTGKRRPYLYHMVGVGQIGSALRRIDPEQLGVTARQEHELGYARWNSGLEEYASFLGSW
jgi:hypothetical protein